MKQGNISNATVKGFANREATSHIQASDNASQWLAEKNRENALNNLPSSLR